MKTVTRLLLSASLAGAVCAHVHIPFSRHDTALPQVMRRDSAQVSLHASEYVYVANISVGTPGQEISVVISPNSADTWVPDATSSKCDSSHYDDLYGDDDYYSRYTGYRKWGSFNKSLSTSWEAANVKYSDFESYGLGWDQATGTNFTDKLVVGGVTFDNYPMGLVTSAFQYIGVLGLGKNSSSYSSSYSSSSTGVYTHFIDVLVKQGKISTPAYSIWLDDASGKSGNPPARRH